MTHEGAARAERTDVQPAADHLAEAPKVGLHARPRRGPTDPEAEPGDHLVEQQKRADPVAGLAETLQEPGRRSHEPHVGRDGFDAHDRDRLVELGHHVVRGNDGIGHCAGGDAVAARQPLVGHTAAPRGEQRVAVAVVATGELHDRVASGRAASEPHCGHRRLGARRYEAHHLEPRYASGQRFGQLDLAQRGRTERGAIERGGADGLDHLWMGVAEDGRAIALHIVDVPRAFDIPHVGTRAAGNKVRLAPNRPKRAHGRVHPAGDDGLRPREQLMVRGRGHSSSASSRAK
ncbi:unannotated protein [freshwater metagenome]|uniref:Unannotated protein n=1 Tax=freshwater metagenome TaxID=449393 RepID=A0A6J7RIH2_9ZZZZ